MASLAITIKPRVQPRKIRIEVDANRFETLAASFGFFSHNFVDSIDRAEKDFRANRVQKIKSLKDLRPTK